MLLVIIFDWDDTILCTTYLGAIGLIETEDEENKNIA